MAIHHAMWVHANCLAVQSPQNLAGVERRDTGTKINGIAYKHNWVHFAIPTPVIVGGPRLRIGPIILRFYTPGKNACVTEVRLRDGSKLIKKWSNQNLYGNNPQARFFPPKTGDKYPPVSWGLGVSVGVSFAEPPGWIRFVGAGCDFHPW